ncbi:LptF/LptG family permease [Pelagibacteraceae bacterium]|nr:LptF/LptG family permease [Pelagibacteraceae bacterium]
MTKRYTPKILISYLIKEFSLSLFIFFSIFLSLIVLSSYIEEIFFFREKQISGNLFIKTFILSIIKTPTLIINMSPFIFLFSGIFFYVKLLRSNEITPFSLSGFSKNFVTLIPAAYSFLLGVFIILFLTPVSSSLSRYYETVKKNYSGNDNLLVMSNTGLWVKEKKNNETIIIRADKIIDQNFKNLKNITIYKFSNNGDLVKRIDTKKAEVKKNNWVLDNAKTIDQDNIIKEEKKSNFETSISLNNLKNFFSNSETLSIWNINDEINQIKELGYYGQELIITLNKYLSLPFLLASMVILATFFTIKIGYQFNNFIYAFFGVITGIFIYFLSDLSIAIGKSGKIPLVMSVWVPVLIIMIFSVYNIVKEND